MNTKSLLIACSILLCSGCSDTELDSPNKALLPSAEANESTTQVKAPNQNADGRVDVTTSQDHNIQLYPLEQRDGMYSAFLLKAQGTEQQFPWKSSSLPEDKPQVFATDLTQDGENEAVIILTLGRGTSLHQQEAHVVDLSTFSEIPISDPEEILAQHITSKIVKKGDHLEVTVQTAEQTVTVQQEDVGVSYRDTVGFGDVVYYDVADNQFIYETSVSSSIAQHVGTAKIIYKYNQMQNKLEAESVTFTPNTE